MVKRIVVLESDHLINAGVLSFLASQDCFDVIGMEGSDPEQIYRAIENIRPDVVIINQNSHLISTGKLLAQFENLPHIRTIILNMVNNQIQVCDQRQVSIQNLNDFIEVL